jgi:hypothetical protein
MLIVGMVAAAGLVIARARLRKLHERLIAKCEAMFERMPDTFPPKKMMSGIEELRVKTTRILELLETGTDEVAEPKLSGASSAEVVHDVA